LPPTLTVTLEAGPDPKFVPKIVARTPGLSRAPGEAALTTLPTVGPGAVAAMSSPNTIPARFSVPAASVGSPRTRTTLLLTVSVNNTPSRLPVGVPGASDVTISTRSLPFAGS
jgi:hypothetical protein